MSDKKQKMMTAKKNAFDIMLDSAKLCWSRGAGAISKQHGVLHPPFCSIYQDVVSSFLPLRDLRSLSLASRAHHETLGVEVIVKAFQRDHDPKHQGLQLAPGVADLLAAAVDGEDLGDAAWKAHRVSRAILRRRLLVVGEEHVERFLPRCPPCPKHLRMSAHPTQTYETSFMLHNSTDTDVFCHWIGFEGNIEVREGDRVRSGEKLEQLTCVSHTFVLCQEEGMNPFALYQPRRAWSRHAPNGRNTDLSHIHAIRLNKDESGEPVLVELCATKNNYYDRYAIEISQNFPEPEVFAGVQFEAYTVSSWPNCEELQVNYFKSVRRLALLDALCWFATAEGQHLWELEWNSWHHC